MLTKNIIKQPKSLMEVQITIPWTDLQSKWDETLNKLAAEVEIPGFRKGQAPLNLAEQSLGQKLQDEFLKAVFPQALIEALQGTEIVPIDYPHYQLLSFGKGGSLQFKALLTERPLVKVGNYKILMAQRPPLKQVTDANVDKLIEDLFKRWKAKQPANLNQPMQKQSGSLSLNEGGGSAILNVQGNPMTSSAVLTSPNDSFAQSLGAQSLTDLKVKIKADLEDEAKFNNELDYEELILQEVEKITMVEVPDILIEDELNRMLVNLQRRVADMGLLLEDYLKGQNETLESLKTKWKPQAEKNVRMELGLAEIGRLENIQISDTELQAEIDKIQDARLKAQFAAQEPQLHLRHSLRQVKTLNLLKSLVGPAS